MRLREGRNQMSNRRIFTRREAAEFLRLTERQVDRLTRAGKLKSFKLGGTAVRFWQADLEALFA
jgi:excisionase family DNA binding protein